MFRGAGGEGWPGRHDLSTRPQLVDLLSVPRVGAESTEVRWWAGLAMIRKSEVRHRGRRVLSLPVDDVRRTDGVEWPELNSKKGVYPLERPTPSTYTLLRDLPGGDWGARIPGVPRYPTPSYMPLPLPGYRRWVGIQPSLPLSAPIRVVTRLHVQAARTKVARRFLTVAALITAEGDCATRDWLRGGGSNRVIRPV